MSQALGPATIGQLATHTGMSQGDVTSQLAQYLPNMVHHLTPGGQLPSADEAGQWV